MVRRVASPEIGVDSTKFIINHRPSSNFIKLLSVAVTDTRRSRSGGESCKLSWSEHVLGLAIKELYGVYMWSLVEPTPFSDS